MHRAGFPGSKPCGARLGGGPPHDIISLLANWDPEPPVHPPPRLGGVPGSKPRDARGRSRPLRGSPLRYKFLTGEWGFWATRTPPGGGLGLEPRRRPELVPIKSMGGINTRWLATPHHMITRDIGKGLGPKFGKKNQVLVDLQLIHLRARKRG